MFDGEDSKVLHIGCWTHCRRLWVDALPSDRTAMDIIDPIGDMFRNEDLFRTMKLSGEQIKEKRRKLTGPILERIHHKVVMMMQDAKNMANELMRKATKLNDIDPQDYLKHLFGCILHGKVCDKKALLPCFYKPEC